jgi:putative transposase
VSATRNSAPAVAQQESASLEKGTPQRTKRRQPVSRVHERVRWKRKDFTHKLSRRLVDEFGVIAFEDLNILATIKNQRLAKSIADAAWNQLVQFSSSKAEEAGRRVVLVDPRNTSKMCSRCGVLVEKNLSERVHKCTCGLTINRDLNASFNVPRSATTSF